jgi:hypothetical protein
MKKLLKLLYLLRPEGSPELPFIACYVLLPHNPSITKIVITGSKIEIFKGTFPLRLSNQALPAESEYIRANDPELYTGYQINKIFICPFHFSGDAGNRNSIYRNRSRGTILPKSHNRYIACQNQE